MLPAREETMKKKIVIAYDGSPNSRDALQLGARLAVALGATPVITYCVSFPRYLMDPLEVGLVIDEVARPVLNDAEFSLNMADVETRALLDQSPSRSLNLLAEEISPVAIVIGSAHSGTFGRVHLGSVGKQLTTSAPCAIVVAPRGFADGSDHDMQSVCVGIDQSSESDNALREAAALAASLEATLRVVTVREPIGYKSIPLEALHDLGIAQSRYTAEMLETAAKRVTEDIRVEIDRLEGDPGPVLADYSGRFDLLVVGSRGYGPLRRVLLGSVSSYLMDHARCPVVVVPRGTHVAADTSADATAPLAS